MIKYYVLEDQRSVVAVIRNTGDDCKRYFEKRVPFMTKRMKKAAEMPASFRVCVECNGNDVFDENVGKEIARNRILANYWRSRTKAAERVRAEIRSVMDKMESAMEDIF